MKTLYKDKAGNRLVKYSDGKFSVKNRAGGLVSNKNFYKFVNKNKLSPR